MGIGQDGCPPPSNHNERQTGAVAARLSSGPRDRKLCCAASLGVRRHVGVHAVAIRRSELTSERPVSKDANVASAISHWAPRFVSNGVLLADFEEVTGSLERWEDWCAAWSRRAQLHEDLGRDSLRNGFRLTAGEHLVRAAIYYHFAKFVFVQDLDQMRAAHMKAVECYRDGIALLKPYPDKRVAIPFEGKTIFGVLRGSGPASMPVVIMAPGLDSTKEELHAYEEPFLARGMATLAIDGPGQGEAEYEIPICGDY